MVANINRGKEEENQEPLKDFGLVAVSSGAGLDEMFKELGVDVLISGGQTMNPSTEDFLKAIKKCHAKNVFILPNNSNIVMAASQACDVLENSDTAARVIPSKTIPQGLVSCMSGLLKKAFKRNFWSKIGYLLTKKGFKEMKETLDPKKTGGALLLGINGVVVKAHVPVLDNGGLLGVFSEEVLTSYLIAKGSLSLSANLTMRDFLAFLPLEKHSNERYLFLPRSALLEDAREAFSDSKIKTGKRLAMVFISEHGKSDEAILGALVPSALL